MSVPPSLPSRPSQSAAAPQLPPRNKPTATAPQNNDKVPAQDERKPSKSPSQPITPRFIAPPPTTDAASKLQHMLQPVFNLLAFKPEDTPEDAALRRQLEEEQISRYMNSFSKHVQYLRMDGGTRVQEGRLGDGSRPDDKDVMHRIPQKPQKEAFRVVHPVDPVTEAGDTAANSHVDKSNNHGSVPDLQKEESFEVDWFGYYAAVSSDTFSQDT
ncbi:hypothetical protein QFC19_008056 [Naganishia cerealis]|uniref:Uncharacterized protein n=1 Tax=Naganishia cerealis TaxID=610337 RepID=A0ACC2V418_9TREE|nr:hypothetical protein QFC19_008056 [Naganishia cerealis]